MEMMSAAGRDAKNPFAWVLHSLPASILEMMHFTKLGTLVAPSSLLWICHSLNITVPGSVTSEISFLQNCFPLTCTHVIERVSLGTGLMAMNRLL